MSFSSLTYDPCAYDKYLEQSIGTGEYMISVPKNNCDKDYFYPSPYIRLDKTGGVKCKDKLLIDVDSELLGLNTPSTKCHEPIKDICDTNTMQDCDNNFLSTEDTKLSNPPCTLRSTGWNRWEWLCENPQDKSILPFQTNISDRTVAKDNHRPLLPNNIDQSQVLPKNECETDTIIKEDYNMINYNDQIPFVHWRCCGEIEKY